MIKQLLETTNSSSTTVIRLMLGLVIFPHGAQKLLGSFGGYGFSGTMHYFTETMHLPWIIAFLVIVIEFFGALALIAGAATRIVAALMLVLMLGIIVTSHVHNGFFMNWFGNQSGEGFEFHLLIIAMAGMLILSGGGKWSVDGRLFRKKNGKKGQSST